MPESYPPLLEFLKSRADFAPERDPDGRNGAGTERVAAYGGRLRVVVDDGRWGIIMPQGPQRGDIGFLDGRVF